MAETKIEWAHYSFNSVVGCTKVSDACQNCYAESWAKRAGQPELWQGERRRTSVANWKQPIKWNAKAKAERVRRRVFCCSLADVFDNQWEPQWRADLWELIAQCDSLDWMLLTKRPQNIVKMLPPNDPMRFASWPWRHVWLGTTAENQEEYDRRWPHLQRVHASVRFLICEPLPGPIKLDSVGPIADLIICGGESGGHARMMDPAWAASLRDQCADQEIAFFMKQMTKKAPIPADLMVRQMPVVEFLC